MNNIVIGRFVPGKGFLYRMDPRTKIISLVLLMASAFVIRSFNAMFIAVALLTLLLIAGRINIIRVILGLRPLMYLLAFTFIFQLLFNTQGELMAAWTLHYSPLNILVVTALIVTWFFTRRRIKFKFLYFLATVIGSVALFATLRLGDSFATGTLEIYENALTTGFFIVMRLMIIVTLSTILTLTTKPTDLNLGLESVMSPLKVFRIRTEEMAMIISISLRYIPTLLDEANKIMLAQASRGVDFAEGKFKDKIMQIVSLLVPMFIISFKRSDELANAMEARSFVPGNPRTRLHQLTWSGADTVALIISILALTAVITSRVVM